MSKTDITEFLAAAENTREAVYTNYNEKFMLLRDTAAALNIDEMLLDRLLELAGDGYTVLPEFKSRLIG